MSKSESNDKWLASLLDIKKGEERVKGKKELKTIQDRGEAKLDNICLIKEAVFEVTKSTIQV